MVRHRGVAGPSDKECYVPPLPMTEAATAAHLAGIRELFLERIPFNRVLGIEIVELSKGEAVFSVPFRPELIGDPDRPALHGGVLSAVADTCGGCAVWSAVGADDRVSTIDLRIDYMRPATPGPGSRRSSGASGTCSGLAIGSAWPRSPCSTPRRRTSRSPRPRASTA